MSKKKKYKIFEAFAGVGSQVQALHNIGIKYEYAGISEWYLPAIIIYNYMHGYPKIHKFKKNHREKYINLLQKYDISIDSKKAVNKKYWNRFKTKKLYFFFNHVNYSINKFNNIINIVNFKFNDKYREIDLLTYSFPCQDLSIQGKQKGLVNSTKSSLLWEIKKILIIFNKNKCLPKTLLLENVPNIIGKRHIALFTEYKNFLESLGYNNHGEIFNAQWYGIPQNRKRFFLISSIEKKIEPLQQKINKNKTLFNILDKKLWSKKYNASKLWKKYENDSFRETSNRIIKTQLLKYTNFQTENYIYKVSKSSILPTLTASGAQSRIKYKWDNKIRFINPRECYNLMDFEKSKFNCFYKHIKEYITDIQIIFTAGNSIPVGILENIFTNLYLK